MWAVKTGTVWEVQFLNFNYSASPIVVSLIRNHQINEMTLYEQWRESSLWRIALIAWILLLGVITDNYAFLLSNVNMEQREQ